jgi:hypothetical protein
MSIQTANETRDSCHCEVGEPFKQKTIFGCRELQRCFAAHACLSALGAKWLHHLRTTVREKIRYFPRRKTMRIGPRRGTIYRLMNKPVALNREVIGINTNQVFGIKLLKQEFETK